MPHLKQLNHSLYTTVTLTDLHDTEYIGGLIDLGIGIEVALTTPLADIRQYENDLHCLKQEITAYKTGLDRFLIPTNQVRVHQPAGYSYYWSCGWNRTGYHLLKAFFAYCVKLGFASFVIHAPIGHCANDAAAELTDYQQKLAELLSEGDLEVEEIVQSYQDGSADKQRRYYYGGGLERLLTEQKATILLDVYECGGVAATVQRLNNLQLKGFTVNSLHLHHDKHKFLSLADFQLLLQSTEFRGKLINEGFIDDSGSFEEYIRSRTVRGVVANAKRITMLAGYLHVMEMEECLYNI
ncbi:MAG TPA: hypothetical protein VEC37_18390 [Bacillota bacterium]|nr:hypothetical protein [Bacillota bacterium]